MKEPHIKKERVKVIYTDDELMIRLKVFIGMCLAITLMGIVFVVLYSIIFVTQPLGAISPVDSKFFELIIPIATFLTGTLSGIMLAGGNKEAEMKALEAATAKPTPPPSSTPNSNLGGFGSMGGSFGTPSFNTNNFAPQTTGFGMHSSPMPFAPPMQTFSGGEPISRNGKLGPPEEEHPER